MVVLGIIQIVNGFQKMRRKRTNEEKREPGNFEPRRYEVDLTNFAWDKRHIDPHIKMIWNDLIKVEPANRERGQFIGWRTYPDGVREQFTVKRR